MSPLPDRTTRTTIEYCVYSPFGDAILNVPQEADAIAYARAVAGRTMECVVRTVTRTPIPVSRWEPQ